MHRLDAVSGGESDVEDTDEYRLCIDDADIKRTEENGTTERGESTSNHLEIESRSRVSSTGSEYSVSPPARELAKRKTSQTLAEAFLEQLPEVITGEDGYQNGSATHEEREIC